MRLLHGVYFTIFAVVSVCGGNPDAKRLYDDLLSNYNKLVRPVVNVTDALTVKIKLKLSQLIDVNLKNQIMTTNLWVEQTWYDYKLKWEPKEYGGVEMLHVPSDHIWRPDIVLYNNADGNFEVTLATKATLNYTGRVEWRPPAIYKSSCEIDVEYFPFDEQTCVMKFGSWTYDGFQVDLRHIDEMNETNVVEVGVDLSEFYTSVEWDILEVPAVRNEKFYTCCDEPYLDITFNITMRRKTLFYTVNLIIPCMGISFLTILVFYLPSDSGEKVSLSISILLSLTVFFLLLAEIIPPTSLVVPLLGKFVLFTMILDTFSICVTVIVLNIHFRSPQTHTMAPWVRTIFINHLPKLLVMRRPIYQPLHHFSAASQRFMLRSCNSLGDHIPPLPPTIAFDPSVLLDHHLLDSSESDGPQFSFQSTQTSELGLCELHYCKDPQHLPIARQPNAPAQSSVGRGRSAPSPPSPQCAGARHGPDGRYAATVPRPQSSQLAHVPDQLQSAERGQHGGAEPGRHQRHRQLHHDRGGRFARSEQQLPQESGGGQHERQQDGRRQPAAQDGGRHRPPELLQQSVPERSAAGGGSDDRGDHRGSAARRQRGRRTAQQQSAHERAAERDDHQYDRYRHDGTGGRREGRQDRPEPEPVAGVSGADQGDGWRDVHCGPYAQGGGKLQGQGGLEVRRDGARPTVSVDLHDSGRVRYGRYHTAGANAVRHTRPDRHQDVGDCDHDGEALHRQTDTIMCVSLRPTSEFTGSPPSGGKWVKVEIPAPINHT